MKRIICLLLALLLSLGACMVAVAEDKGEPTVTADSVGYDDATVELTWLPQEAFDSANKPVADYFKAKAIEFVKKHPEVRIKLTAQTVNIQDAMAKLLTQAAAGNAPDLASVDSFVLPSYYPYLQSVTDVFNERGLKVDSWFPFAQQAMVKDGEVEAMWIDTDVRALYYQKALIPTAPKTWSEVFSTMEGLKDQGYMFLYPAGKNETTSCDIWPLYWSLGGKIVDETGKPIFNEGENRDKMLALFNTLKQTVDTGITPTRVTSFMTDGDVNADVLTGKVAMFIGGSWVATQLAQVMGKEAFDAMYAITTFPAMDGGEVKTCCGGWTCGVFAKDDVKRKLAAELAIDVYISDEGMDGYTTATGNLPCRADLYGVERFQTDATAQGFKDALAYGEVRPGVEIYNFISTEFQVAISDVITGVASPEQALDTMAANVDAEYAKKS